MFWSTHGHTGAIITTSSVMALGVVGLPIGLGLSFVSHFLLDYIQEYNFGSMKAIVKQQIPSMIVFLACLSALLYFGKYLYFSTFILGYLAGNLPDFIDKAIKGIKKARPPKKRFSCHNGDSFLSVGNFKLGYPTKLQLDKTEQNQITFVFTILILVFTVTILK